MLFFVFRIFVLQCCTGTDALTAAVLLIAVFDAMRLTVLFSSFSIGTDAVFTLLAMLF
jgi:hypothetical protein